MLDILFLFVLTFVGGIVVIAGLFPIFGGKNPKPSPIVKSLKWQVFVSIFTAICFVYFTFSNIEFSVGKQDPFNQVLFFFIMVVSVFNAGLLTQKYIQTKKKE
ncbi:hypothetical protein [Psychrobacillus sp. BM2]|uniref:hypothetical protein n=1 Tax=Psychrobacillus sp. BM2 TaxID=3400421 RepID=UPI003B013E7F